MLMTEHTPTSVNMLFPLIAGIGLGMLFHAPYQVFTRALRRQEVASGTSAFFLVRFTGATVGLVSTVSIGRARRARCSLCASSFAQAVAGAVFLGQLSDSLPAGVPASNILEDVDNLRPTTLWPAVVGALALAIKVRPCPTASRATPVAEFYPLFVCALCRPYGPSAAHAWAWLSWSVSLLASAPPARTRADPRPATAHTQISMGTRNISIEDSEGAPPASAREPQAPADLEKQDSQPRAARPGQPHAPAAERDDAAACAHTASFCAAAGGV